MKKIILLISLISVLASCGGGGGGGGSAPQTTSATPVMPSPGNTNTGSGNTNADIGNINTGIGNTVGTNNGNNNGQVVQPQNPAPATAPQRPTADNRFAKPVDSREVTGQGVKVGVLDSDFLSGRDAKTENFHIKVVNSFGIGDTFDKVIEDEFEDRMTAVNKTLGANSILNKSDHGLIVATILAGRNGNGAKGALVYGVSFGESGKKIVADKSKYEELYNSGVRIFNQSFGVSTEVIGFNRSSAKHQINNGSSTEDILGFYQTAVNNGALFIWAAGNESFKSNPSLEGGLPYLYGELEKGWINVVGLAKDSPTNPGSTNWEDLKRLNGAGVAKNWTVSVVSGITVQSKVNGLRGTYVMNGSSFAAPIVAGTAALIKEKYPWMTGDLIRQTILSTATDIGKKGIDEDFGWGLLNIGKALNGPALFDKRLALGDNVVADVTAGTYTFSNNISGDAGFIKNGLGTLKFTGNLTYTGNTTINNGTLIIKGVTYNSSSTRIVKGNLVAAADVNIQNDVQNESGNFEVEGNNVTVGGNYTASENAKTTLNSNASLHVAGKVALGGSTIELKSEKDGVAQYVTSKGTEAKITSDNEIEGNVANVETAEMLKGDVEATENGINATLSRKNVEEYVSELSESDAMRKDVAENLEASFKKLDEEIENGNSAVERFAMGAAQIQAKSLPTRTAILDSLSGQIYASAQALTFQHSQTVNKDLSNRLVMLGTLENVGENAGVWVTGIGANGKLKQEGFGEGKTKVYGGQAGIDKQFGKNLILGTAISYSTSKVNFDRHGGKSDADNVGISLYGRLGNKEVPYYLQGRVGVGFVDSNVERDIILGTNDVSRVKINHNDTVYSGYLETGYDVKKGNFTLTPYVGLAHDTVRRGSFTEENSQFGLTAGKKTYSQTAGLVGLRVGQGVNWSNGSKSTFQAYVTHQRAFKEQDLSFEAAYTGLSNAKFTVKGIGLSKNQTWVGAGVLTEVNPGFAWYVNYDGKIEKKGRNNVFTTGLRFSF